MPRKMSQARITSPDTRQKVGCRGVSWINFGVGKATCILSLIALDLLSFCGVHNTRKDAAWLDEVRLSRQKLAFTVRRAGLRPGIWLAHCKECALPIQVCQRDEDEDLCSWGSLCIPSFLKFHGIHTTPTDQETKPGITVGHTLYSWTVCFRKLLMFSLRNTQQ